MLPPPVILMHRRLPGKGLLRDFFQKSWFCKHFSLGALPPRGHGPGEGGGPSRQRVGPESTLAPQAQALAPESRP